MSWKFNYDEMDERDLVPRSVGDGGLWPSEVIQSLERAEIDVTEWKLDRILTHDEGTMVYCALGKDGQQYLAKIVDTVLSSFCLAIFEVEVETTLFVYASWDGL